MILRLFFFWTESLSQASEQKVTQDHLYKLFFLASNKTFVDVYVWCETLDK